ncbi:MAG: 1-deoxy-D-xylulose-5-phosphate reductoisomerase [Synergistaceae bacterium]|nr:1-deoxy-D-xylulose-5-phosphate reductoisomerase [Synergistaceae bacterium]
MKKTRLFLLGCTGSVGSSVLSVCRAFPDQFQISVLAARSSVSAMAKLAVEFSVPTVILTDPRAAEKLRNESHGSLTVLSGDKALEEASLRNDVDHLVVASSGTAAIPALMSALRAGKDVSLANKESIVVAGPWVLPLVQRPDQLRPLDSEHNALWQCLQGRDRSDVAALWLTASGGPFRNFSSEELEGVTPAMAAAHPVWPMGAKISVDSATLMNKGIEIMEAMALFSFPSEAVRAIISPEAFIHGIVQFRDGTFLLAGSAADMRLPCASALFHPERCPVELLPAPELSHLSFNFEEPDESRFPCLSLAREVARRGGAYPALLVGADEIAVDRFLSKKNSFPDIPRIIAGVLEEYSGGHPASLDDALSIMEEGRRLALQLGLRLEARSATRRSI